MKVRKNIRLLALVLVFVMMFFSGCSTNNSKSEAKKTAWDVTDYNLSEVIDKNGEFILNKLNNVKVSELKKGGDKKVIYHLGEPYLFHAMHLRIDHLQNAGLSNSKFKSTFEDGMRLVKESGYDTVILYLGWDRFYDGAKYDFTEIEYQYSIAKKYDLKIMWNWFGYDVCGFGGYRDWQLANLEKYPPLKDENGNVMYATGPADGRPIPDLSVQSFIDIEVEAIQQLCAWLNVNDTDRRTIGIQLENEPNHFEGGHGLWFSQYSSLKNLINELGRAVKEGPYSMITYTNLMASGWDQIVEGRDFNAQVKGFIDLEYLDIVGYDMYTSKLYKGNLCISYIEQGDNPHLMVEFGPCQWCVPGQTNLLLSNGYGIGYYQLVLYNDKYPNSGGLYSFVNRENVFVLRDGSHHLGGDYNEYNGCLEVVASEFIVMNNSIKALSQLIAISANDDITYFNSAMMNSCDENIEFFGKNFSFETNCAPDRYGATGLLIKENDLTYYTYASKTATITVEGGIKSASEGVYKNGKWVKTKEVKLVDGTLTYEAGKAYQFIV